MDPLPFLKELVRVVRPGGLIVILFWSSQKLLLGHPFLEARLNATRAACLSISRGLGNKIAYPFCALWLCEAGLKEIRGRTFAADVQAPSIAGPEMILLPAFKCSGEKRRRSWQMEIGGSFNGYACKRLVIS